MRLQVNQKTTYLSWPAVQKIVGDKSRTTVWRWTKRGLFPRPVQLGPNSVGWKEHEVVEWGRDPAVWAAAHRDGARAD